MSSGILGTALSGLSAYQLALQTTSNNISNANTAGYSVENAQFATQPEQYTGSGYVGTGVNVNTIARSYNQFLNAQVLSATSAYNASNTYYTMASQIDNMIADQNSGLSSSMSSFFSAVNGVANDPTSTSARQVMLSDASALASQFNNISATFSSLSSQVNGNLSTAVNQLNGYASTIAQLNTQIVAATNNGTGQTPNALLDQRDALLTQISQLANVSVVSQNDGSINVYIGQGQPLVLGSSSSSLSIQSSSADGSQSDIMMNGQDVSNLLSGGQIAGILQFRNQVLNPAQQQLGLLATGLATEVNNVQQSGADLNGDQGLALFTLGSPSVQVAGQYSDSNLVVNASFVAPTAADVSNLGASYQLTVTGTSPSDTFSLTNLTTNTTTTGLTTATLATTAAANGFSINFSGGTLTTGDTFNISPDFNVASSIQVNSAVTTPSQIAAAGAAEIGTANSGDNSNVLAMADLQNQALMANGTSTFSQMYGQLVSSVGTNTSNAQLNSTAQNTVLQNATSAQQSVSGVNLNEEATNLVLYQNSYQAAAKVVTVAQSLFSSILTAIS